MIPLILSKHEGAWEFQDEFDRQRLAAQDPEIEIVTYGDILHYVQQRRLIIQGSDLRPA